MIDRGTAARRADLVDNLRPCRTCPEHLQPRYRKALERLAEIDT